MKLSVLIPVYNEEPTIARVLKQVAAVPVEKEIVVVNDGSKDRTLENLQEAVADLQKEGVLVTIISLPENQGKGAAVRRGLAAATGDIVVIQDADLELNPICYPALIAPILEGKAKVVYGSRFLNRKKQPFSDLSYLANIFLTRLTNLLYHQNITDMETCYKTFVRGIITPSEIRANRFELEPELTTIFFKKGFRICEIPVEYSPRTRGEGKKINWKDGCKAVLFLCKSRFRLSRSK